MSEALNSAEAKRRRLRPYPKYKDSGVEWLGDIPAHWTNMRLRHIAPLQGGYAFKSEDIKSDGIPIVRMNNLKRGSLDLSEAVRIEENKCLSEFFLKEGDLLLGLSGSLGETGSLGNYAVVRQSDLPCQLNQRVGRFVLSDILLRDFLLFFIAAKAFTDPIIAESTGTAQFNVSPDQVGSIVLALPPHDEQMKIAEFLDRETAKIDTLIENKKRLIELLQEKRAALITQAVTKGLDRTVPMKDSGVEWLGEIPTHWEVKRLWHLTPSNRRIMYGIVLPGPNVDDGIPIVKGGDVSPERLRLDRLNRTSSEIESGYVRSRLRGGDLVYAIRGSIGEVAVVPDELTDANLTQDAARIAYTSATHGLWLLYELKSSAVFAQLEAGALGATIRGLNIRDLKRASIPVPPRSEQEAIAGFLEREMMRIEALLEKIRAAIDLLKEYRTSLISAAVTGKIDVRHEDYKNPIGR